MQDRAGAADSILELLATHFTILDWGREKALKFFLIFWKCVTERSISSFVCVIVMLELYHYCPIATYLPVN